MERELEDGEHGKGARLEPPRAVAGCFVLGGLCLHSREQMGVREVPNWASTKQE